MAQVGGDGFFQQSDAVMCGVAVEVGVEICAHRNGELACRRQGRPAQRAFGGDVHDVRAILPPQAQQQAFGGQSRFQFGVTGNRHTGDQRFFVAVFFRRHIQFELARADQVDAVIAPAQAVHHAAEGDGDAIDLGQVGFGDQCDIQRPARTWNVVWCIHAAHDVARA